MSRQPQTDVTALSFTRQADSPVFTCKIEQLVSSCLPAWRSHGGPQRGHPARSYPFTLDVATEPTSSIQRLHLLGVFAEFAGKDNEAVGTLGASVHLLKGQDIEFRQDLVNGRHYFDASILDPVDQFAGDGTQIRSVGVVEGMSGPLRVDLLSIDVPENIEVDHFKFKDLGSAASFWLFDVFLETLVPSGCPFRSSGGGIALSEIGPIVRLNDRVKFTKALSQLENSLLISPDLDEARGQALTFLAVVTAGMLEMGGSRQLHREQLEAARELEQVDTQQLVAEVTRRRVEEVAAPMFKEAEGPSSYLVDRALAFVDRNFAKELTDSVVASQLGLSTSHFRFLFKQATGQPFHKYLVALRLEKARQMLAENDLAVSTVARAVGFTGLSHFSRAFTQRFKVSPTSLRRTIE